MYSLPIRLQPPVICVIQGEVTHVLNAEMRTEKIGKGAWGIENNTKKLEQPDLHASCRSILCTVPIRLPYVVDAIESAIRVSLVE